MLIRNLDIIFSKITSYKAMSLLKRSAHFGWYQVYNFSHSFSQNSKEMNKNICSLNIRKKLVNLGSIQLLLDQRTRVAHPLRVPDARQRVNKKLYRTKLTIIIKFRKNVILYVRIIVLTYLREKLSGGDKNCHGIESQG